MGAYSLHGAEHYRQVLLLSKFSGPWKSLIPCGTVFHGQLNFDIKGWGILVDMEGVVELASGSVRRPDVPTNSGRKYRAYPTVAQQETALGWSHTLRAVRNMVIEWARRRTSGCSSACVERVRMAAMESAWSPASAGTAE